MQHLGARMYFFRNSTIRTFSRLDSNDPLVPRSDNTFSDCCKYKGVTYDFSNRYIVSEGASTQGEIYFIHCHELDPETEVGLIHRVHMNVSVDTMSRASTQGEIHLKNKATSSTAVD